ncbi:hypothetical protein D4R99_03325 [bacterium]|nr:MAG: hypothetical protein D4R99_03325 [bacterium]
MPYLFDQPKVSKKPVTRPVKEFLSSFKKKKMKEETEPSEELIFFLNWLRSKISNNAKINQRQEKEIAEGIDWVWWSTDGEPIWDYFLNLLETMPQ